VTVARGPQLEQAWCWWCGETFTYTRTTKPRVYCRHECAMAAAELTRDARRRARNKAARALGARAAESAPEGPSGPGNGPSG
jgi:hypothetical protein